MDHGLNVNYKMIDLITREKVQDLSLGDMTAERKICKRKENDKLDFIKIKKKNLYSVNNQLTCHKDM